MNLFGAQEMVEKKKETRLKTKTDLSATFRRNVHCVKSVFVLGFLRRFIRPAAELFF